MSVIEGMAKAAYERSVIRQGLKNVQLTWEQLPQSMREELCEMQSAGLHRLSQNVTPEMVEAALDANHKAMIGHLKAGETDLKVLDDLTKRSMKAALTAALTAAKDN